MQISRCTTTFNFYSLGSYIVALSIVVAESTLIVRRPSDVLLVATDMIMVHHFHSS